MAYNQPFKQVGKVKPELKNQSKSSLMMKDVSPLSKLGPGDPNKKEEEKLTEAQKLTMLGAALKKDVSFEVKTIDDPRSSRSIISLKNELKKKNPDQYKQIYGK